MKDNPPPAPFDDKENIVARLAVVNERIHSLKSKAAAEADIKWAVGGFKTHGFDCDAPSSAATIDGLDEELSRVLESLDAPEGGGAQGTVLDQSSRERERLETQLRETEDVMRVMKAVQGAAESLEAIDNAAAARDYDAAVEGLAALETTLSNLPPAATAAAGGKRMVGLLRRQCRARRASLHSSLAQLWRFGVQLQKLPRGVTEAGALASAGEMNEPGEAMVARTSLSGFVAGGLQLDEPIALGLVLDSLEKLGGDVLKDLLADFCKQLSVRILEPLLAMCNAVDATGAPTSTLTASSEDTTAGVSSSQTISVVELQGDPAVMELSVNLTSAIRSTMAASAPASAPHADDAAPPMPPRLATLIGLLADLTKILDFVHRHCLDSQRRFTAALGNLLLSATITDGAASSATVGASSATGTTVTAIGGDGLGGVGGGPLRRALFHAIESVLPHEAASLSKPNFAALQAACASLDSSLFDMGYLFANTSSSSSKTPVSAFVASLPARWAARRREELLDEARRLMVSADYHNSVPVGGSEAAAIETGTATATSGEAQSEVDSGSDASLEVTSPLGLPRCHVTQVAVALETVVNTALQRACDAEDALPATTLYRTARELLDLFRAVVPQHHAEELASMPRLAALFHNDCLFLAHHALRIAHRYRRRLPTPLNKCATMVDMIPALRGLGEQVLQVQLNKQQLILDSFTQGVEWVQEPEAEEIEQGHTSATDAGVEGITDGTGDVGSPEEATRKLLYHLHQLANLWQPVLSRQVYAEAMGRLLRHAADPLMNAVLGAEAIDVAATTRLHRIFKAFRDAEGGLFGGEVRSETPAQPTNSSESEGAAAALGAWWDRLCILGDLMVWSLNDIGDHLSKGTFRNLSAAELCRLLEAIFMDSPELRNTLKAVRHA